MGAIDGVDLSAQPGESSPLVAREARVSCARPRWRRVSRDTPVPFLRETGANQLGLGWVAVSFSLCVYLSSVSPIFPSSTCPSPEPLSRLRCRAAAGSSVGGSLRPIRTQASVQHDGHRFPELLLSDCAGSSEGESRFFVQ